jgi:hypothetical protein
LNTTKTQETMPQKMELALMSFVHVSSVFVDDTMPGAERECPMSSLCVCHYIFKGAKTLGISAFQALVKPSKGYALLHESFQTPPLAHNLSYVASQMQISIADCSQASDIVEGSSPSIKHHLEGCIVDIPTSRYVVSCDCLHSTTRSLLHSTRYSFVMPSHLGGA